MYRINMCTKGSSNLLNLRRELKKENNKYYVYVHYKDENPIYIGSGTISEKGRYVVDGCQRCFSNTDRPYIVKDFVDYVEIIDFFNTKEDAIFLEEKMTETLKKCATWNIYNKDSGRKHSSDTIKNFTGKNNHRYGTHPTEETIEKMKKSKYKKVVCINIGKVYNSILEASEEIKVAKSGIISCCRGIQKTSGKFKGMSLEWCYLEDLEYVFF